MKSMPQPSAVDGLSISPKVGHSPAMKVSSAIAEAYLVLVQREECLSREISVFSSAHKPLGDVLSSSALFSLRVLRSLHQQP